MREATPAEQEALSRLEAAEREMVEARLHLHEVMRRERHREHARLTLVTDSPQPERDP
jgi:hypothetical protein